MRKQVVARVLPILIGLLLDACAGGSTSPTATAPAVSPSPTQATPEFVLFAMGDSIPYNSSSDCPGCTGFIDSFAAALQADLGDPVGVINRSRHDGARTINIVDQVTSEELFRAQLATADLVVLSIGINDQPPFADPHKGCPVVALDADALAAAKAAAATSTACIDSVIPIIQGQVAEVFTTIREQAPEARIAALTAYDTWLGWSALDELDRTTRRNVVDNERYWFQQWRKAMCAEAQKVDAVCVDVYRAFNGPDGTRPVGDLVASDYTHPSQKGNDRIRDLLLASHLLD
jgi:lysophospholipase L1-like esterase